MITESKNTYVLHLTGLSHLYLLLQLLNTMSCVKSKLVLNVIQECPYLEFHSERRDVFGRCKIRWSFITEIMVKETYNNTVAALLAPAKHVI